MEDYEIDFINRHIEDEALKLILTNLSKRISELEKARPAQSVSNPTPAPSKPKTFHQELQRGVDVWLKDVCN